MSDISDIIDITMVIELCTVEYDIALYLNKKKKRVLVKPHSSEYMLCIHNRNRIFCQCVT